MSNTIYTPYTYLIGWSNLQKFYYGVRYAKGCSPSDLCESYFTSSKYVHLFIQKNGLPDVIQIRRTFQTAKEACDWEDKVLKRLNVTNHDSFLNRTTNYAIVGGNPNPAKNLKDWNRERVGKTLEEVYGLETATKMREVYSRSTKAQWQDPEMRERMRTKKNTSKMKEGALRRWSDPEQRKKVSGKRWIKKTGEKSKFIHQDFIQEYLDSGWEFGR